MALDFYHTSHTNTCQTVQWCLRALSQQAVRNCLVTTHQSKWHGFKLNSEKNKKKHLKTWFEAQHFNGFHCFFPSPSSQFFHSSCFHYSLGVSPIRKTSGPRLCADGPDKARKTLMFIRQSLYRFHRCQSGKVTVTAPIKENGQNGNKGTDWELKLGNNASPTNDYSG